MNNSKEKRARRIASLLTGYIRDTLTPAEHDELDEWVGASDRNMRLFEEFTDEKRIQLALDLLNDNNDNELLKELREEVPVRHRIGRSWKKYVAAASIVIIAGAAVFFVTRKTNQSESIAKVDPVNPGPVPQEENIPVSYKGVLTIADGSVYDLSKTEGIIATEGTSQITSIDGELKYQSIPGQIQNISLPNSVTTPRGGKCNIVLPDGTKAWMSSDSYISYPAVFTGNERRVRVKGEVYFEVTSARKRGPNYKKPFIVEVPERNMAINVLGTHFNVNSRSDEENTTIVLAEGSISLSTGSSTQLMKPNQQAQVTKDGSIALTEVDASLFIGWKDGILQPKNADLGSLMKELGRWYNVDVVFTNPTISARTFSGVLNVNSNLSKNLHTINAQDSLADLSFVVEGRKIIVRPS